jgi:hypothetical protein
MNCTPRICCEHVAQQCRRASNEKLAGDETDDKRSAHDETTTPYEVRRWTWLRSAHARPRADRFLVLAPAGAFSDGRDAFPTRFCDMQTSCRGE